MGRSNPDLDVPRDLSPVGAVVACAVRGWLQKRRLMYTGGSRAFYSPTERGAIDARAYPGAVLIICHDGGNLAPVIRADTPADVPLHKQFKALVEGLGCRFEWVSMVTTAIYIDKPSERPEPVEGV